MAFSYLLSGALCSFLSLNDRLRYTASCQRWFSQIFTHFQSRKLCFYIPSPLSRNPLHTTKTALITASSIHRLLTFVHKDGANGCFRVPAAGANTTRILIIDSKSFRFPVYIQTINFHPSNSVIIWMFVTEIMIPCVKLFHSFTWQLLSLVSADLNVQIIQVWSYAAQTNQEWPQICDRTRQRFINEIGESF